MIRKQGWWMGAVLVSAGVVAVACGGAVDLDSPRAGAGSGGTGGTSASEGGTDAGGVLEPSGGTTSQASAGNSAGGSASGKAAAGEASGGGGEPTPNVELDAWLAFDAQPNDTPRGIYLMSALRGDTCTQRLTDPKLQAKQPAFSDDGRFLAYAGLDLGGTYQIYVRELGTGITTQLTQLALGATYPAFSPTGLEVVFVNGDPEALRDDDTNPIPNTGDVELVNVKTREVQLLKAADPRFPYFSPVFSGADRIVIGNTYVISSYDMIRSGQATVLSQERVLTAPSVPQDPATAPDGLHLAFVDTCGDTLQLYKLTIDIGSGRNCTPASRNFRHDQGVVSPSWGSFGYIAAENLAPGRGILLFSDEDLTLAGGLATPPRARNPAWAPATFDWFCSR